MKRYENGFQSKMDLLMTEIDAPLIGANCNCRVNYLPGWTRRVFNSEKEFLFVSAISMILKDPSLCLNSQNENSQMPKQPRFNVSLIKEGICCQTDGKSNFFGR